jgi:glycosyltransferase involved in cell wall biosynthesis
MKLLQINTTINTGSTGRIMEEIGQKSISAGYDSTVAYRKAGPNGSRSAQVKIGNELDRYLHGIKSRLLDLHGFGSKKPTKKLIETIREIDPDIIGIHNLHGYYMNVEILFQYLKEVQKPVVWTFHDCWPFTGHCTYFDRVGCEKWKTECHTCPQKTQYPASYGLDNSKNNFHRKKELFTGLDNLTIVTPSTWLKDLVKQSFLQDYPVEVIHNGIDLNTFRPNKEDLPVRVQHVQNRIILGVASVWDERKGLADFKKLAPMLDEEYQIVLVGLTESQIRELPDKIIGIARTENVQQLASLYSTADAFLNPTWTDNFPTTNIEALACGTPVITYDTGGSPEAVDENTGFVVEQGDLEGVVQSLQTISEKNRESYREPCRQRAVEYYNKEDRFQDYIELYERMLEK